MILSFVLALGCTPEVADAPAQAASSYCDQAIRCAWFSESERGDCESAADDIFAAFWEPESCPAFEPKGWDACMDAIQSIDCEHWLTQGLEDFQDTCAEERICE